MSHVHSKIDEISQLQFEPFQSRKAIPVTKAAEHDGIVVALGSDGRIYSSGVKSHVFYHDGGSRIDSTLKACMKMRVLTAKCVRQHLALMERGRIESSKKYRASQILEGSLELGLKLTSEQQELLKSLLPKTVKS